MEFPLGTIHCDGYIHTQLLKDKPLFNPVFNIISIHLIKFNTSWDPYNYTNINHFVQNFLGFKKYKKNQTKVSFCKIEDCPLKKKRVRKKIKKK